MERAIASSEINSSNTLAKHHAGFWARFAAGMIDLVILAVPFSVFVSFLSVGMNISKDFLELHPGEAPSQILTRFGPRFLFLSLCFFAVSSWLYFALQESSSRRATLGKRLLGLYVGDKNGNRVGFGRASLRFLSGRLLVHVPVLGGYYFLADCLCIALLPEKRAIHDLVSGCQVLREATAQPLFRSLYFDASGGTPDGTAGRAPIINPTLCLSSSLVVADACTPTHVLCLLGDRLSYWRPSRIVVTCLFVQGGQVCNGWSFIHGIQD